MTTSKEEEGEEEDDDKFSDVFQGDLMMVEVTKNFMHHHHDDDADRLFTLVDDHHSSFFAKIDSIIVLVGNEGDNNINNNNNTTNDHHDANNNDNVMDKEEFPTTTTTFILHEEDDDDQDDNNNVNGDNASGVLETSSQSQTIANDTTVENRMNSRIIIRSTTTDHADDEEPSSSSSCCVVKSNAADAAEYNKNEDDLLLSPLDDDFVGNDDSSRLAHCGSPNNLPPSSTTTTTWKKSNVGCSSSDTGMEQEEGSMSTTKGISPRSSEKRRDRRRLRQSPPPPRGAGRLDGNDDKNTITTIPSTASTTSTTAATNTNTNTLSSMVGGVGSSTTTTTTATTTTTTHAKDCNIPIVVTSNERMIETISSVGTCVKIRERRKKIVRQHQGDRQQQQQQPQLQSHQSESKLLPDSTITTTELEKQDTKEVDMVVVATVAVVDDSDQETYHCSSPSTTSSTTEVALSRMKSSTTSPERPQQQQQQVSMMKRRQKIVERVGKQKVPIIAKKAWLQTRVSSGDTTITTISPSSSPLMNNIDTTTISASTDASSSITPITRVDGSTFLPSSEQLIVSIPANELGLMLANATDDDEEEEEDTKEIPTHLPLGNPSNFLDRHKARSQRRQLRNHAGVLGEGKVVVDDAEDIQEITPVTNPGSPSSLEEKHQARSHRRIQRKGRETTSEEFRTFDTATMPTHEMSEMMEEGGAVDDEEAKALFPEEASVAISSSSHQCLDSAPLDSDTAWDVKGALDMSSILEKSKVENIDDSRPLLHLGTNSSENDGETSYECASAKLLSQQERIRMYDSGGFGEGDNSSVEEDEDDEDEEVLKLKYISDDATDSDNFGLEVFAYEDMENIRIEDGEYDQEYQLQSSNIGIDDVPTSTTHSKSRDLRWDQNPDAMSEAETESDFFDAIVTDATGVVSMRFVGNTICGKPIRSTPPPPQSSSSSSFELDPDITPKIRPNSSIALDVRKERNSVVELPKIPPPPPEKLRDWEQSKTGGLLLNPIVGQDYSPEKIFSTRQNGNIDSPGTPGVETASSNSHSPPGTSNLNYKIQRAKSPQKKKQPHSLTDELDLAGHTRMAEKIVIATSKAARKFEEQYSHLAKSGEESLDAHVAKGDSHYYTGDATSVSPSHTGSPGSHLQVPAVGELVGGAFSPWKIPDRAEDESSIASLARILQENESYTRATAAAVKTILGRHDKKGTEGKQDESLNESFEVSLGDEEAGGALTSVLRWLFSEVLPLHSPIVAAFSAFDINTSTAVQSMRVLAIANDDASFNLICKHVATNIMIQYKRKRDGGAETEADSLPFDASSKDISTSESSTIIPFEIPPTESDGMTRPSSDVLAASFVNFLQEISNITGIASPFPDDSPLATDVLLSKKPGILQKDKRTVQDLLFPNEDRIVAIFRFLRQACLLSLSEEIGHFLSVIDEDKIICNKNVDTPPKSTSTSDLAPSSPSRLSSENRAKGHSTVRRSNRRKASHQKSSAPIVVNPLLIVPHESPSPFETAVWNQPSIVLSILSFLGNPVAVCSMKRLNVFCSRVVRENQHVLMRDAVRLGGMSKFIRPSFWLWVTEMCKPEDPIPLIQSRRGSDTNSCPKVTERNFLKLKDAGAHGKWNHVIERDVTRAFGNMPPHKTGARYRQDSIVRALVSFGREEIIRNSRSYQAMDRLPEGSEAKHFKLSSRLDCRDDSSNHSSGSVTPTDTVSDWGGISPVGSFISEDPSNNVNNEESIRVVSYESDEILDANMKPVKLNLSQHTSKSEVSDPVLSGNALTSEMKVDLQNKLRSILHALAARHEAVGYCQGMDYIVAHLLRVLQDTILLRVIQRSMPTNHQQDPQDDEKAVQAKDWRTISSDELRAKMSDLNSQSVVVEEIVFGVMDTFFSTYNLQHMYWPELRCLKTCCRVFEILIKQKLPVLADHFQHYELNVGLFALGWFQTLFLYLPSMPSATVCHIWDIWLVERSFKIFFRIGTAILFLSQPTLLNNDLEGMMTYLNTFPDATLLRRDILIPCALQIKITNRMLVEIEMEVAKSNNFPDHNNNEYFPV